MIGIIGVGSIGKNLLDSLEKKLPCEQFIVIDDDIVNRNNIQYKKKYIGQKKVLACIDQYDNIKAITQYVENNNLSPLIKKSLAECSTIFDCRDTFENRTTFDAIKIFVNKDKLIVDFRKKILFRYAAEGEYISYISDQFIKSLISTFTVMWTNKKHDIDKYIKNRNAISINQIGLIEELFPSTSVVDDIDKLFKSKTNIDFVKVDVIDGLYNIMNKNFDLNIYKSSEILKIIDKETESFPAVYLMPTIVKNNMCLRIINQTGGA